MPYELQRSSPRLWFVVNVETGKKHEEKPISLKKAKAQLRILKKAEVSATHPSKTGKPKKSKVKGGYMAVTPYPYSTLEPNGYNPNLGGAHWYRGNQPYNLPYAEWIDKHPWMVPFGVWGEQRGEHFKQVDAEKLAYLVQDGSNQEKILADLKDKKKELYDLSFKLRTTSNSDEKTKIRNRIKALQIEIGSNEDKYRQLDALSGQPRLGPQEQKDWLEGYDFIQSQFNYYTHEVWRESLNPERYGTDDAKACGKFWGCCYNRSWQWVHDWTSTGEQVWDAIKTGAEIGKTIAELVV